LVKKTRRRKSRATVPLNRRVDNYIRLYSCAEPPTKFLSFCIPMMCSNKTSVAASFHAAPVPSHTHKISGQIFKKSLSLLH
jgi:hypothetical protein